MKKSLSLLLAIALVFSAFSSLAFAADQSVAEKLVNAGVIKGTLSGDLKEDETWKRQDVTVIIARLMGKETEAQNTAKNHTFADVTDPYYDGFITWGKENGYFKGTSDVRFGYNDAIEVQEFLAVMLRVLGYDVAWGDVPAKAVELGLIQEGADMEAEAVRGEYFVILDTTLQTPNADGEKLGEKLGLPGYVSEVPALVSAAASGAKKVTVKFSSAVDTAKASFSLKRGNVTVNFATAWNDAKTEATLTSSVALQAGEYTVTVSGIELAEDKNSATFTVAPERIETISIDANGYRTTVGGTTVTVGYKVLNQYGEDITSSIMATDLTATTSVGTITSNTPDATAGKANGTVTISNVPTDKNSLALTIVDEKFAKSASQTVTVLEAKQISSITIEAPKVKDGKTRLEGNSDNYEIPYVAKDQYGNDVKLATADESKLTFVSSDASVINTSVADNIEITSDGKLTVDFENFNGPKEVSLTVIVNGTGQSSKATFTVYGNSSPQTPVLVAPTNLIGAGENNVEIQLIVKDEYGNDMTADDIVAAYNANKFTITSGNTGVVTVVTPGSIVKSGDKAVVKINAVATGTAVLTVTVNATGQSSTLTISVVDAKYPSVVNLDTGSVTKAVYGAQITLKGTFKDQYGQDLAASTNEVRIELDNSNFTLPGGATATTTTVTSLHDNGVVLTAAVPDKTTKVTVKLYKGTVASGELVDTKEITLSVLKNDAALTYEVESLGTIATAANGALNSPYAKEVKVIGKDASGDKVALRANTIQLVTSSDSAVMAAGQDAGVWKVAGTGTADSNAFANVTVLKPDGSTSVIAAPVTVSKAAPAAVSIVAKQGNSEVTSIKVGNNTTVNNLFASNGTLYFEVKDQYGTTALSSLTNVSVFVTDPSGAINKLTAPNYTFTGTSGQVYKVNAVIGDKSVTVTVTIN